MPATGIEPVLYRYNRILSPARLPVPPRRHYSTATYIRKPSLTSYLNMSSYRTTLNGQRWIRTTEASCSRFTVCPLWPLGNLPITSELRSEKAGDGNRTHVSSLEGWCSTIELHPRSAQFRNRTRDTRIFSPLLYQLS